MDGANPYRLPARVDLETAPAVLEAACGALAGGTRAFDLAGCAQFDSGLVAVLIELARRAGGGAGGEAGEAGKAGAGLRILNVPPNLRRLAALYGVEELLLEPSD